MKEKKKQKPLENVESEQKYTRKFQETGNKLLDCVQTIFHIRTYQE